MSLKNELNIKYIYMKIFDYKLILLLGLTSVIYFMHRELLTLNKRIEKLETSNFNKTLLTNQVQPKFINLNKQSNESEQVQNISEQTQNESKQSELNINKNLNDILPNESCSISTENEGDSSDESSCERSHVSETPFTTNNLNEEDAVEVFSNDNVDHVSTYISPENNIENNVAVEVVFHPNDEYDLNNLNLSNTLTDSSNIDDILLSNIEIDCSNNNIIEDHVEEHVEDHVDEYHKIDKLMNTSLDIILKKNKLNDLKNIAEKLNIELRINGRAKTKKQLAQDIYKTKISE